MILNPGSKAKAHVKPSIGRLCPFILHTSEMPAAVVAFLLTSVLKRSTGLGPWFRGY